MKKIAKLYNDVRKYKRSSLRSSERKQIISITGHTPFNMIEATILKYIPADIRRKMRGNSEMRDAELRINNMFNGKIQIVLSREYMHDANSNMYDFIYIGRTKPPIINTRCISYGLELQHQRDTLGIHVSDYVKSGKVIVSDKIEISKNAKLKYIMLIDIDEPVYDIETAQLIGQTIFS